MWATNRRHGFAHLGVVVKHGLPLVKLHELASQVGESVPGPHMRGDNI